eukprot:symbB.v1.2.000500.t1/scaffold11.1/size528188/49
MSEQSLISAENQLVRKTLMKDLYKRISLKSEAEEVPKTTTSGKMPQSLRQEVQRARDVTVKDMLDNEERQSASTTCS